ncbi:Chemotaxis protein motB [Erwinia amylovora MR1]|nr:Chemotaxis protein motB [Erwinia amylovora MR1]
MWLISISSPQQLVQIADYFKTPLKVALTGGQRSSDSSSPIPGGGLDPTEKIGEVHKVADLDKQKVSWIRYVLTGCVKIWTS